MTNIVSIDSRQGKNVGIIFHDSRSGRAGADVVFSDNIADRRVPSTKRIGEKINGQPGVLLNLGLASGDLLVYLVGEQIGENRMGLRMCPETELLFNEIFDLRPGQQIFFGC